MMKKKYTKKQIQNAINYWKNILKNMKGEFYVVNICETADNIEKSNASSIEKFLNKNREMIINGINFLEAKMHKGFKIGLKEIGFTVKIVPDNEWSQYKNDPTETSKDNKCIRIKESYFKKNPNFFNFDDEYGWSLHEFGHAIIFAGKMNKFLSINSPFGYPLNTDEIYTFGFQIKNIDNSSFEKLVKYETKNSADFVQIFRAFKKFISTI